MPEDPSTTVSMRERITAASLVGTLSVTLLATVAVVVTGGWGDAAGLTFIFALFICAGHTFFLGVPLMWLLARFNAMRWWTMALGGALIGALPFGIWAIPGGGSWPNLPIVLLALAGLGAFGALCALFGWKTAGPGTDHTSNLPAPNNPGPSHSPMSPVLNPTFGPLNAGAAYRVVKEFRDFDNRLHAVGEAWTFIGSNFVPYDDGLSLYATIDGGERQVRLQWRPEAQGEIIGHLGEYLAPAV